MDALEELVAQIDQFPTLPDVAVRVIRALGDDDCDLDEVGRMIELDLSLSARIVKLANSPLFGPARESSSVKTAIMRLGIREVKTAITTIAVMQALPQLPAPWDLRSFWTMGLASGLVTRQLAQDLDYANPDEAYLGGLVHLVGSGLLAVQFTERYQRAIETAIADEIPFDVSIAEEFGCDQAAVGARILESWHFPEPMIKAVRYQYTPAEAGEYEFLASLLLAGDRLSRDLGLGFEQCETPDTARIGEIPPSLVERIESYGYPDLTFYLIDLKSSLGDIEDFARSVFGD